MPANGIWPECQSYCDRSGMTYADIAREAGISADALRRMREAQEKFPSRYVHAVRVSDVLMKNKPAFKIDVLAEWKESSPPKSISKL
jgi:transposase-like protein